MKKTYVMQAKTVVMAESNHGRVLTLLHWPPLTHEKKSSVKLVSITSEMAVACDLKESSMTLTSGIAVA